jgi:TolA-binding protein
MTIFNDEVLSVGEIAQNERIRLQKEFSEQITKLYHDIAQLQNNISHLSKQNIDKNEQIMVTQEQNQVLVNYVEKNQNAVSKYRKTTFKFESKECFQKIVNSKRSCRKSVVVCEVFWDNL